MKTVYPAYYKRFVCAAGECPDTCCAGWDVVVDDVSAEKYARVEGDFGEKLRKMMTVDEDGDTIFISQSGRCPFLNEKNLCEIYINCGEDFLCRTCDMFPRFVREFGSLREIGLGLGCPEAAKLIVNEHPDFISETDEEAPAPDDFDPRLFTSLYKLREKIFDILFRADFPFEICLANVMDLTEKAQNFIDDEDCESIDNFTENFKFSGGKNLTLYGEKCKEILSEFEVLNKEWSGIIARTDFRKNACFDPGFRNIAAYYIYRYFLDAVDDYDALSKISFCAFSCEVIARVNDTGIPLEDAARLYSKEAEYSAENLGILYDLL